MCERSIQIGSLHGDALLCFDVVCALDETHQADSVCYHNQNDAHVFCHRHQQASEILALDGCTLVVKVAHSQQAVHYACDFCSEVLSDVVERQYALHDNAVEQYTQYGTTCESHLLSHHDGCLHVCQHATQAERIPKHSILLYRMFQTPMNKYPVI